VILQTTDQSEWFERHVKTVLLTKISEFQERDSGWTLHYITNLTVNICKSSYNPIRGRSYFETPRPIAHRRATLNIRNRDHECFRWCVLAAKHPRARNAERVNNYIPYRNELNFGDLKFPFHPKQTSKFEKLNQGFP